MKKVFTLLMAIIVGHTVFATATTSGNWRWRNDDGNDVGKSTVPTWAAAENTPITLTNLGQHIRLRITNYSGSEIGTATPTLSYTTNSSPSAANATPIPTVAGGVFVMVASNFSVVNGQSSPSQISDASGVPFYNSFNGAIYSTSNGPGSQTDVPNTKYEAEYIFKPSSLIQPGTKYYFVIEAGGQTPGTVLSGFPSLTTTAGILPVTLTDFNVVVDANGNEQITWATATESNSANYVIESSIDGINFSAIATVASKKAATGASYAYSYTKGLPNGINYIRLKAVDKDGSFTYSGIKLVNITAGISKITIAPNPVKNTLNIAGVEKGSYVQVYNINAQKILSAVATGASLQQINVSNLSHGAYYVQIVNANKVVANQLIIKQ